MLGFRDASGLVYKPAKMLFCMYEPTVIIIFTAGLN
jgi:hypothetical protein